MGVIVVTDVVEGDMMVKLLEDDVEKKESRRRQRVTHPLSGD